MSFFFWWALFSALLLLLLGLLLVEFAQTPIRKIRAERRAVMGAALLTIGTALFLPSFLISEARLCDESNILNILIGIFASVGMLLLWGVLLSTPSTGLSYLKVKKSDQER